MATATGSLVIGAPVTGTLTTTPAVLPPGTATVTNTLTINTGTNYPSPLTLKGAVTASGAGLSSSVVLYPSGGKTYAYESGTGGIDAIDVTDPTNPQLITTFGQNDLGGGQFADITATQIVGNELFVGTSNSSNGTIFDLLVYALTNPASPTLVSTTPINYRFLSDLLVNSTGTAAFVPTNGILLSFGDITNLFGDLVAIDLSNPAMPALASALFNDVAQPDGGNMEEYGGTLVNDSLAYLAGLTPGGTMITGNTGDLLVVNVADPDSMSVVTSLTIPDTYTILNVAVSGTTALVVGDAEPEPSTYNAGATGAGNNLTLTVLNIANPEAPQIMGSTLVTSQQLPIVEAGQDRRGRAGQWRLRRQR